MKHEVGRLRAGVKGDYWEFYLVLDNDEVLELSKVHFSLVDHDDTREAYQEIMQLLLKTALQRNTGDDTVSFEKPDISEN